MNFLRSIYCFFVGHKIYPLELKGHIVLLLGEEKTITTWCKYCNSDVKVVMTNIGGNIEFKIE